MARWLLVIVMFFLLISLVSAQETTTREPFIQEQQTTASTQKNLVDEQGRIPVYVSFREPAQQQKISTQQAIQSQQELKKTLQPTYDYTTINAINTYLTQEEINELQNDPLVEEIIPARIVRKQLQDSTNILRAPQTWNMTTNGRNLTGKNQTVCVLDTGIDYDHPDLGGGLGPGFKVIGGFNIFTNDTNITDLDGHGTHVAGIIAANGNSKGVAPEANLVGVKVLDDFGFGSTPGIAAGIDWCVDNKDTYNITVISMSLGTKAPSVYANYCDDDFPEMRDAIHIANDNNITVVAATGNDGLINEISSPACISGSIPVGSTTKTDVISGFSNLNSLVKLLAPGGNSGNTNGILSTMPNNTYATKSGTSMATPHVAGAYAIVQQHLALTNQQKTAQEIETILFENSGVTREENGNTYARIDVLQSIANLKQLPETTALFPQGWQNKPFNITLNVTFNNTAINHTTYRVNENPWANATTILIEEEGNNTVAFYSVDVAGNIEPTNTIYALLDLTAPNTTSNESSNWKQEINIFLNATDNLSGTNYTTYRINEEAWINGINIFFNTTGNHTLFFYSVDNAGNNETTKNATILIDNTRPTIVLEQPSGWQNNTHLINWTVTDEHSGVQNITYQKNNETIREGSNLTITQEGNHTLTITATDNANNTQIIIRQALLDLTLPHTTITNEVHGWQNNDVTLLFNATDNVSGVNHTRVRINEQSWTNSTNITLSDGNHTIFFRSVDNAGNVEDTKNATVLIDTIPPIINAITRSEEKPRANKDFIITANITDQNLANATITIREETSLLTRNNTIFNTTISVSQGTYTALIRTYDLAGNTAEQTMNFTVYTTVTKNNIELSDTTIRNNTIKTSLRIRTNNLVSTNITLRETNKNPADKKMLSRGMRFVTIELPQSAQEQINWSTITINYTQEELDEQNLDETTIQPYYYNETTSEWDLLEGQSFINSITLNTTTKQLVINTTQFSTYALSAEENQEPTPSPQPSTSGSSSGSGGGGGGVVANTQTSSNSSTQSLSLLSANNLQTIRFNNDLLSIKQITFIPLENIVSAAFTLEKKMIPQDVPRGTKEYYELTYPQDLQANNITIYYTINITDPKLYRYANNTWVLLNQEQINEQEYRAYSEGFSKFALVQSREQESIEEDIQEEETTNETTTQPEESLIVNETIVQEEIEETKTTNTLLILFVSLIVLFTLGLAFFLRKK